MQPECEVRDIRPLPPNQPDRARYEIDYRRSTGLPLQRLQRVRTRQVILSAGVLGTMRLLFRCRDVTRSLPALSPHLGTHVRTNSEALLGVTARQNVVNYSDGVAITSIFQADDVTQIEPVRYPHGSSLMRFLAAPLIEAGSSTALRLAKIIGLTLRHPLDFARAVLFPNWARRTTILLVMQTEDNLLRLRLGRGLLTLFRRGLVTDQDPEHAVHAQIDIAHRVTRAFADQTNGIAESSVHESLFNIPTTAHILGGAPMGHSAEDGVINLSCEVFNYPGLYIVDGSIMPANPGVNPSLTITALAEYAMSRIPPKIG